VERKSPMNKNCIQGGAKQGERARNREALVTKTRQRRCGGCVMKVCVLYSGRSRLTFAAIPSRMTHLSACRAPSIRWRSADLRRYPSGLPARLPFSLMSEPSTRRGP